MDKARRAPAYRFLLTGAVAMATAVAACNSSSNSHEQPGTTHFLIPAELDASTPDSSLPADSGPDATATDAPATEGATHDVQTPDMGLPDTQVDSPGADASNGIDAATDVPEVDSPGADATNVIDAAMDVPATAAVLSITDTSGQNPYDFGSVTQGTTSTQVLFTVTNAGGSISGVPTVTVTGANANDFQVTSNGCTSAVAPNSGQCQVGIKFAPSTSSSESAVLTVSASPGGSPTIGMKGAGVAPVPSIALAPPSWTAPATSEGATTPPSQTFTVTNGGTGPTQPLSIAGLANGFAVPSATDACSGKTLSAGGGSCTFAVTFAPSATQAPGPAAATMVVTDSPTDQQSASLSSVALCPTYCLVITPDPGNWGMVTPATAAPLTFTVTNYGLAAAPLIGGFAVANAGMYATWFGSSTDSCTNQALAAYGSAADACTHIETFTAPVGVAAGSLPTSPQPSLQVLGATGGPLTSDPLEASW